MLIPNYGHKCVFLGLYKLWLILIAISLGGNPLCSQSFYSPKKTYLCP